MGNSYEDVWPEGEVQKLRKLVTELKSRISELECPEETAGGTPSRQFGGCPDTFRDGMVHLDPTGTILDVNRAAEQIFGGPKSELIGKHFTKVAVLSPDDLPALTDRFGKFLAGDSVMVRIEITNLEGRVIPLEYSASWVKDGDEVSGIMAVIKDITERKTVEEFLIEKEEFSKAVIDWSPLGISVRSCDGTLLSFNESWKNIWAFSDEEIRNFMTRERTGLKFDENDGYLGDWSKEVRHVYEEGGYLHIPEAEVSDCREGAAQWVSQYFYAIRNGFEKVERVVILTEDITERKCAVQSLKESEEKFKALAETANCCISIYHGEDMLYHNPAVESVTGYTPEELLKIKFWDIVRPDYRELIRERSLKRRDGEPVPSQYEIPIITKSGEERWVETRVGKIQFRGKPASISTAFDITERKRAEEALRESEEIFKSVAETANCLIAILRGLDLLYLNPYAESLTGYTQKELLEMGAVSIVREDYRQRVEDRSRRRMEGQPAPNQYEIPIITKPGEERWVDIRVGRTLYEGKPAAVVTAFDITERKRAQEALQVSAREWGTTFDAISDSVCLVSSEGIVLRCNKASADLLGKPVGKIIGCRCYDLLYQDQEPTEECLMNQVLAARGRVDAVLPLGDRWLNVSVDPIMDEANNIIGAVVIIADITQQKLADEALSAAHEQLSAKHLALTEKNTTLNQVLNNIEEEKREARDQIAEIVEQTLKPALRRLRRSDGSINENHYVILERGLDDLSSGNGGTSKLFSKLSPREAEICSLIRGSHTSKEIAEALCISLPTVKKHRENIRKKLKLTGEGSNLTSFLRNS
jgi:PAS domain S-box-containing protein